MLLKCWHLCSPLTFSSECCLRSGYWKSSQEKNNFLKLVSWLRHFALVIARFSSERFYISCLKLCRIYWYEIAKKWMTTKNKCSLKNWSYCFFNCRFEISLRTATKMFFNSSMKRLTAYLPSLREKQKKLGSKEDLKTNSMQFGFEKITIII